jgi:adenine deaminase
MDSKLAFNLVRTAKGQEMPDLLIKNINVVDVYNKTTFLSDVLIKDGYFAGFGKDLKEVKAAKEIDGDGKYLVPGFIDAHCHIESSHLSPSAFSDAIVPCGTTTVIADPHEICNVCGLDALDYMLKSSQAIPLSVYYMFPSCVPATDFEHAGAVLTAEEIRKRIGNPRILGLGEMMNYPGLIYTDQKVLDKLQTAYDCNKNIDGHSPAIVDSDLDAYTAARITTDHECATPEELKERVRRGMYVMLRQGTACKNVLDLLPGVTAGNSSRILFCTDDRQPESILGEGHINYGVNLAIKAGLDPITAISMASLNASVCYKLSDRGAIAPGLRADCFITASLTSIIPEEVFVLGREVAAFGSILEKAIHTEPVNVSGMMNVANFSAERLQLKLNSDHVRVIDIIPGGVVTGSGDATVKRDDKGLWVHDPDADILKLAVVERHKGTGNVAVALIRGYGMKHGAVATSIAHDSHNIIVIGDNDDDMATAVEKLISIGGGITTVLDGKVLATHRLEIAGLMTDLPAEEVCKCLKEMHDIAYDKLKVSRKVDPFMTLCFMALPVIPELKLTDCGLFDVTRFSFVPLELE